MIKDLIKPFTDKQERNRQERAEREMARKRTEALAQIMDEEGEKLEKILKEFKQRRG